MYPNNPVPPPYQQPPQQQAPLPVDYLNQIAPQQQQRKMLNSMPKKILFFLGIAVFLVIILVIIINVFTGGQKRSVEELAARLTSTAAIAKNSQKELKSSQLRSLNAGLQTYFTNTTRESSTPFQAVGVNTAKLSSSINESETKITAATNKRLEDARFNAVFDRTYAREMAYQLGTLQVLFTQAYNGTNSASLKTYLDKSYKDLAPIQEGFADFSDSIE
jgi:hypothetical protein